MKCRLGLISFSLVAIVVTPARAQLTAILDSAAAIGAAQLDAERGRFLAWLDDPKTTITEEQMPGVRERLYYLIGSSAQAHRRATGELFPLGPQSHLATLFERASRLGLYGAGLVSRALGDSGEASLHTKLPGAAIRMAFEAPFFTMRSERNNWSIRFPYYFMVSAAETQVPSNGVETEALMLSTLFGAHRGIPGYSQATIMIIAARPAQSEKFVEYWLDLLGIAPGDTVPPILPDGTTYRASGGAPSFEKEIVALERGAVTLLIAYIGLPGTYEANRPDFLALLESLEVTP